MKKLSFFIYLGLGRTLRLVHKKKKNKDARRNKKQKARSAEKGFLEFIHPEMVAI